jgi:hypothetical protein
MTLSMPDGWKADTSDRHLVMLGLVNGAGERVNVAVWGTAVERHGKAIGHREAYIDANRDKVLAEVLDAVIAEASRTYETLPEPRPRAIELR